MNKEREKRILERILVDKKVTVKDLAKSLYASEPSIRRDLLSLERQKLVKRIHGGAVIEENGISDTKIPFAIRELEQSDAKVIIAKKALEKISDNDVIFLDASSSAYNLIPFLPLKNNITVVTSGIRALDKLCEYKINTVCTGGKVMHSCFSLVGEEAYDRINEINADIVFFSCRGVTEDGYLTDISPEENFVRKRMIKNAKQSYLLCSSDKIGKKYFHNLCHMSDITGIISEKELEIFERQDIL